MGSVREYGHQVKERRPPDSVKRTTTYEGKKTKSGTEYKETIKTERKWKEPH